MKKITLSLAIVMIAIFVSSCQVKDDASLTRQDAMFEIASSDLYYQYSETINERAFLVATKAFDGEAIDKVLAENPHKLESSDFEEQDFAHIRGGIAYYRNSLLQEQLGDQLDEKFDYDKYSVDEALEIYDMYKVITKMAGEENLKAKVFEYLQNNFKQ